ncbi:MAG: Hpt domain-containing protein [Devosia sp.]|nr:Hpt domain-containing protein [Devosia sp.]
MSRFAEANGFAHSDVRRTPARPIDMMHLAKQALGDPGLELEILRAFSESTAKHFSGLENSTNLPDLLHHLHTLKGASIGVGAWSLAEHAHIMNRELKSGMRVDPELVEDIRMAVEEVQAFIAQRIAEAEAVEL